MKYIHQDITEVTKGIIAHGVNTRGAMGAGVALYLKRKHPRVFTEYVQFIDHLFEDTANGVLNKRNDHRLLLGRTNFVKIKDDLIVANCFSQTLGDAHIPAIPDAIELSLGETFEMASNLKLPLYMPKIGCGLGGLNWEQDVEPIVARYDNEYENVDTYVCTWP